MGYIPEYLKPKWCDNCSNMRAVEVWTTYSNNVKTVRTVCMYCNYEILQESHEDE